MVAEQTKEWSAMVLRQLHEEHQLLKMNIQQQNELLSRLMSGYQEAQMKDLESRHERFALILFPHSSCNADQLDVLDADSIDQSTSVDSIDLVECSVDVTYSINLLG